MSNQAKEQHTNILLAVAGFAIVVAIVALIGFLARAEIWIYNIKIDQRRFPFIRCFQRKIQGNLRLSAAIISGNNKKPGFPKDLPHESCSLLPVHFSGYTGA